MDSDQLINVLLAVVLGFMGGWIVKTILASGRLRREERLWNQQIDACKDAREAAARKIRQLRSRCAELEASFASVQAEMTTIRDNMELREQSVNALRADLFDAKGKIEEVDELRAKLADRDQKLIKLNQARTELAKQAMDTSELESLRAELDLLARRSTQLEVENAELLGERAEMKQALSAAQDQPQPPPAPVVVPAPQHNGGQEPAQVAALERRVNQRNAVIDQLRKELELSRQHVSKFQQRLHQTEQEQHLSRASAPLAAPIKPPTPIAPVQMPKAMPQPSPAAPTASADDLTQIKGIGAKLESMLNDMGITSFRQLAKMNDSDVAQLSENLTSFKDRPLRDDWVSQARNLLNNES